MKTRNLVTFAAILLFVLNINFVFAGNNDWMQVPSGNSEDGLVAIQFVNANTGYITGTRGLFLKTTDGGLTWVVKTTGQSSGLLCVHFIDAQTGIVAGSLGRIIRTTDGGETWTQLTSPTANGLGDIFFVNATTGYITGINCTILKTTDAGLTWIKTGSTEIGYYSGCYFSSATDGIVTNSNYNIRKTTNSGVNWTNIYTPTTYLNDLRFVNSTTGFAAGEGGLIVKSTNAGNNWVEVQSATHGYGLNKMVFCSEVRGYAVGRTSSGNNGVIISTVNRGDSWSIDANTPAGLVSVACNGTYVFAIGDSGKVYRSINPIGIQNISSEIPSGYKLGQNYPNPFNPVTNIEFSIPKKSNVTLSVFDITGRVIQVLVNSVLSPGSYKYDFNANNLSSGTYFYKIQAGDFAEVKKMVLVK